MLANQRSNRLWNTRLIEKKRRIDAIKGLANGKVLAQENFIQALEQLIVSGDKVVLEGNNQKQADFLARMLCRVDPEKVNNLHMLMPSIGLPEHLDIFEKGIAKKLDFSFSGTQSLRISQLLSDNILEIGAIHTYIELYARLFVDLIPNVALVAAYKAMVIYIPVQVLKILHQSLKPQPLKMV